MTNTKEKWRVKKDQEKTQVKSDDLDLMLIDDFFIDLDENDDLDLPDLILIDEID